MPQGVFIVVDGTDGSGKTSTIKFLTQRIQETGREVFPTEEATRSPFGLAMRNTVRNLGAVDPWALQMLFVADRVDHRRVIQQAIAQGMVVVCDRYQYSGIAFGVYDICARLPHSDPDDVRRRLLLLHEQLPILRPNIALVMSVPAQLALERIAGRSQESFIDRFETEQAIAAVHKEFLRLYADKLFPEMRLIDNSGELAATFKKVWHIVESVF